MHHYAMFFIIDKPLEWGEQPRKTFDDDTVEMDITHCGICASDLFTLDSGWGKTDYPVIVGHEVYVYKVLYMLRFDINCRLLVLSLKSVTMSRTSKLVIELALVHNACHVFSATLVRTTMRIFVKMA